MWRYKGRFILTILTIFFSTLTVVSGQTGYMEITAPEVKNIIDNNEGEVIHVLSKIEFDMQHITGSMNIPVIYIDKTQNLPKDFSRPVVFYCMGLR